MAYRLPTFNLLASLWTCANKPSNTSPAFTDVPVQKYIYSKPQQDFTADYAADLWVEYVAPIVLRFPRTDPPFDTPWPAVNIGIAEVPQGSGQYYRTHWQDIAHEGFPNEYHMLVCVQCDDDGKAWPPPGRLLPTGYSPDVPCP